MTSKTIHRPARTHVDPLPKDPLVVPAPPVNHHNSQDQNGGILQLAMPILAGGGMVLMMLGSGNMLRMVAGLGFVGAALLLGIGMFVRSKTGHRKRTEAQRQVYLSFLDRVQADALDEIELQRQVQHRLHPHPGALLSIVGNPARIYERRRWDQDFGTVRIGTGAGPLARGFDIERSTDPTAEPDVIAAAHLDRMRTSMTRIDDIPMAIPLTGTVSVVGSREAGDAFLRAALSQLITFHAPEDAYIHLCLGEEHDRFEWLLFAPHLSDSQNYDGPSPMRRTSATQGELQALIGGTVASRVQDLAKATPQVSTQPLLVVVVDSSDSGGQQPSALLPAGVAPETIGICVISLARRRIDEPSEIAVRVEVSDEGGAEISWPEPAAAEEYLKAPGAGRMRRLTNGATKGSLDRFSEPQARALSRALAPIRMAAEAARAAPLESVVTVESLLGIEDVANIDTSSMWTPRPVSAFLRVPFAVDTTGNPVYLDLKESGLEGHGPHGLCIGATGSGKSEVLRTLVLAQALTHGPDRLAFVLVDYKGGAAFSGLEDLPHTAAMVDNLSDQDGLVDRLQDALVGEMNRRQRVLQDANAKNIFDYNDRRQSGAELDPLPNLAVIIDEFGEILVQKPEFLDVFVQIGRIGRSIGIHLLLASQRLEEGRLRGLESHLSYRIGLRTFSAQESRSVIGTTDAHTLPAFPGSGYLKVDPDVYVRFKSAYVSGRYEAPRDRVDVSLPPMPFPYSLANTGEAMLRAAEQQHEAELRGLDDAAPSPFDLTVLQAATESLARAGERVKQIWLPPLPDCLGLDAVVGQVAEFTNRGIQSGNRTTWSTLGFPIGVADDPANQWQGECIVDTRAANVMIIGAPQTGKSTTVRALVTGSALTHTPNEVNWYVIDAAGTAQSVLAGLPHVGDVATRFEPDKIRRTVAELAAELRRREALFNEHRLTTAEQMRQRANDGALPELSGIDRYLVIDGYATFATDFEDLVPEVTDIAIRGLGYGLHVVIVANRVVDMRTNLHSNLATIIEHRLNSPMESNINKVLQERIPSDVPGRILTKGKLLAQVFDPDASADIRAPSASAWNGAVAPPVRMLPDRVSYREIPGVDGGALVLGVDEAELGPATLDLMDSEPHLLIVGDPGSGRTTLLRTIIGQLVGRSADVELSLVGIDPRRSLLGFTPDPPMTVYSTSAVSAADDIQRLVKYLEVRLPPQDVTPEQLRTRSWWAGPEVVVVVDDYDVLVPSSASGNPLMPLVPLLPHTRDIGLHLVIARRASGVTRALFDPVLGGIRDNGAAVILLSGDRSEGQILTQTYLQNELPGRGRIVHRGTAVDRVQFADRSADDLPDCGHA